MKYVPSTVVCGPRGHCVTRGYTDLGNGIKIYDDQVVVGERGQHVISRGWVEWPGTPVLSDIATHEPWLSDRR